jgi:hypothetical protein
MPATHARFLWPLSQADRPIMALRRSPLLDTSMARNNRMHMPVRESDLDYLDKWLSSDGSPPNSMMLSDLDGFPTAVAARTNAGCHCARATVGEVS